MIKMTMIKTFLIPFAIAFLSQMKTVAKIMKKIMNAFFIKLLRYDDCIQF